MRDMAPQIPPVDAVKARLLALSHAELQALAERSEVPFGTLWKVRSGVTTNPGMETVRKFWPHLPSEQETSQ
jgi:predicted transcriptional regulator